MSDNISDYVSDHVSDYISKELSDKYKELKSYLKGLRRFAVAFSGGVDSTFLLHTSREAVGDELLAVILKIKSLPLREYGVAEGFCNDNNIPYIVIEYDELKIDGFTANPPDRCYICKKALFSRIRSEAEARGFSYIIEGSNASDMSDYRPGMKALKELEILSPLLSVGLTKSEIRLLSKNYGLSTWNKKSMACLSSRFAYGEEITEEKLRMVDKAEECIASMGFDGFRVRMHGDTIARIEVAQEDQERFLSIKGEVIKRLHDLGFRYITLDMEGYRTGSMNEVLGDADKRNT